MSKELLTEEQVNPEIREAWGRLLKAVEAYNAAVMELRSFDGVKWDGPNAQLEVKMCRVVIPRKVEPL